jgi:hypothetical protein
MFQAQALEFRVSAAKDFLDKANEAYFKKSFILSNHVHLMVSKGQKGNT